MEAYTASPVPAQPAAPPPLLRTTGISFKNSRAVWVSLVVAAAAFVCSGAAVLVSPILWPLVLVAAGFTAAVLYKGQSAEPLSTAAGARLGWMTGIWLFLVIAIGSGFLAFILNSSAASDVLKQLQSNPQFAKYYENPREFIQALPLGLIQGFFLVTLLPGLGGILGAKLSTRGRHS